MDRRVCGDDNAIAAALDAAREHADEQALASSLLESDAVQRSRKIGHGAEIELAGHHFVGQRRAAREVLPLNIVGRVFVFPIMWKIFFQQLQFANQEASGRAVDRRVLGADGDADRFSFCGADHRAREQQGS